MPKRRIGPGPALDAARVAGAAPAGFTARIERVVREPRRGLVVRLREGPELIFGDGSRLGAKWAGAARVLADPDATGADYVDVRLPGRPAAGGLPRKSVAPVAPLGAEAPLAQPATRAPAQPQL
jgi:cell division protein FtsQ